MKDLFLADAHLLDPDAANYRRLLAFLAAQEGQIRTLYLLGDICEFWMGYRHVVFTPYVPLLAALQRLRAAGAAIVYVEGNHDFNLGPSFRDVLGCTILPDGGEVVIDGRRVHLCHGDLINPKDRGYRWLRAFLRSAPLRWLNAIVHPDVTWAISRWGSRKSRGGHAERGRRWHPRELILRYARERFAAGCEIVVTGHFHTPFSHSEGGRQLIALGDWIEQYSYACYEDGVFTLNHF